MSGDFTAYIRLAAEILDRPATEGIREPLLQRLREDLKAHASQPLQQALRHASTPVREVLIEAFHQTISQIPVVRARDGESYTASVEMLLLPLAIHGYTPPPRALDDAGVRGVLAVLAEHLPGAELALERTLFTLREVPNDIHGLMAIARHTAQDGSRWWIEEPLAQRLRPSAWTDAMPRHHRFLLLFCARETEAQGSPHPASSVRDTLGHDERLYHALERVISASCPGQPEVMVMDLAPLGDHDLMRDALEAQPLSSGLLLSLVSGSALELSVSLHGEPGAPYAERLRILTRGNTQLSRRWELSFSTRRFAGPHDVWGFMEACARALPRQMASMPPPVQIHVHPGILPADYDPATGAPSYFEWGQQPPAATAQPARLH